MDRNDCEVCCRAAIFRYIADVGFSGLSYWPSGFIPTGFLSVLINTNGTAQVDEVKLANVLQEMVDLSPRGIREHLQLSRPIYARTAAYGHFGREPDADGGFSWEKTDLVDELKSAFGAS